MKKYLLFLIVGGLLTSCGKHMTKELISQNGTRTYEANKNEVWDAVKGALATEGYEFAYENKEKGVINTEQKLISASSQGNSYSAATVGFYRQYLVKIEEVSEEKTKVALTPRIYEGNNDISEKKIWVVEGKNGEKTLWDNFFKKVEEFM